jgi:hypothetical protein
LARPISPRFAFQDHGLPVQRLVAIFGSHRLDHHIVARQVFFTIRRGNGAIFIVLCSQSRQTRVSHLITCTK